MGKKREPMTFEEIRAQVFQEIPYVHGRGREVNQRRTARMKVLMRRHGISTEASRFEPKWDPIPRGPVAAPGRIEILA